ncbi:MULTISPECIES: CHRD domain-containing protein [unclassified Haladaptatus]|uniref:CHRD domain-containing protein n=1 Tax=unclassified Haladaptatus TaxID=2622732 RepID=UPI00209C2A0B|nr:MULTISPECIES: CHRD domain-containing protein [unclassified Haladaptatus]MCO8245745.1 CHRD domain-containing protein [Haladaptatus sp. AB643]MCO8256090.1 CHRD domain-containing protein [Haladaptatus sp. AB618]
MPDSDKRQTLKLLSFGTVALSGIGAGVVAGDGTNSSSTDESGSSASDTGSSDAQGSMELFSTRTMMGEGEVPSNDSDGQGVAVFRRTTDGTLDYGLLAFELEAPVTKAHIHVGKPGENGPHVVSLIDADATGEQTVHGANAIATGAISDDDLVGPYEESSLDKLVSEMADGNTYVNVHSEAYPEGEIRGRLFSVKSVDVGVETTISTDEDGETDGNGTPSLDVSIMSEECQ